jgi:(1->4)-alpha-D-glucan 1-alpha-D-glucosylmutase
MNHRKVPGSSYRLQFNRDFTFADAERVIPYLSALGITHVYASPLLKARAGSPHGYDIVDHDSLNPEIGSPADFDRYVAALHRHGMGQILDIVPNHVGVGGDDNGWWLDVLEHGESSAFAGNFDIDWQPVNDVLSHKILAPFLGDHYGSVLERGELALDFDAERGAFGVRYYEHLFPVDPRTYPLIFELPSEHDGLDDLRAILASLRALPRRSVRSAALRQRRRLDADALKSQLAEFAADQAAVRTAVRTALVLVNGNPGDPASFDRLHRLLEHQAYRLAYWAVAADEINYRRFFDINGLAGIRTDKPAVFESTHRLIRRLIAKGDIDGLRLDHPDGLSDPARYFRDLRALIDEARPDGDGANDFFPVYVEKILADYEKLPEEWPVSGTTGYEVAAAINGLLVCPDSERALSQLFSGFSGQLQDFDELLYACKKRIIRGPLSSELNVLANLASRIAELDRHTRDFTYHGLRLALAEVAACFPVYRTYMTATEISEEDRRYVQWATARARKRHAGGESQIFDFIESLLTMGQDSAARRRPRPEVVEFASRFQQYTAPVMAKGLEDTAMYRAHRLISLNDVGFDPRNFGISVDAFHRANENRLEFWPGSMVTTSTHDGKRGEDVRARIHVISEVPEEWRKHLRRWSRVNRSKKRMVDDVRTPSRSDEYLLYQTLLGVWPLGPAHSNDLADITQRVEDFMIKAVREAKLHSSWIAPNAAYEDGVRFFIRALLEDPQRSPFLADFLPFKDQVVRFGLLNSLSQTVLRLTVPGTPDTYQGNELWAFNLVDPDNRRPVDFQRRRSMLEDLARADAGQDDRSPLLTELIDGMEDGRIKLYVTWKILQLRRRLSALFASGRYLALGAEGPKADHLCAFTRCMEPDADDAAGTRREEVMVVVPRWFARLAGNSPAVPLGTRVWGETRIRLTDEAHSTVWRNHLSGQIHRLDSDGDARWLSAARVLGAFPVAVLEAVTEPERRSPSMPDA